MRFNELMSGWVLDVEFLFCEFFCQSRVFPGKPGFGLRLGGRIFVGILQDFLGWWVFGSRWKHGRSAFDAKHCGDVKPQKVSRVESLNRTLIHCKVW